jgi:hypothetical protein
MTFGRQHYPVWTNRPGHSAMALTGYFCDGMRTDTQTPIASTSHDRTLPDPLSAVNLCMDMRRRAS